MQDESFPGEEHAELIEIETAIAATPAEILVEYLKDIPEDLHAGYLKRFEDAQANPNEVAGLTKTKGLVFEVSRIHQVVTDGIEEVDFDLRSDEPIKVTYFGYQKRGADLGQPPTKELSSDIDIDVPIVRDGKAYVYEAKSSPRLPYGSLADQRNQLLKYQRAIENGDAEGATIEVNGRVDRAFLEWLQVA